MTTRPDKKGPIKADHTIYTPSTPGGADVVSSAAAAAAAAAKPNASSDRLRSSTREVVASPTRKSPSPTGHGLAALRTHTPSPTSSISDGRIRRSSSPHTTATASFKLSPSARPAAAGGAGSTAATTPAHKSPSSPSPSAVRRSPTSRHTTDFTAVALALRRRPASATSGVVKRSQSAVSSPRGRAAAGLARSQPQSRSGAKSGALTPHGLESMRLGGREMPLIDALAMRINELARRGALFAARTTEIGTQTAADASTQTSAAAAALGALGRYGGALGASDADAEEDLELAQISTHATGCSGHCSGHAPSSSGHRAGDPSAGDQSAHARGHGTVGADQGGPPRCGHSAREGTAATREGTRPQTPQLHPPRGHSRGQSRSSSAGSLGRADFESWEGAGLNFGGAPAKAPPRSDDGGLLPQSPAGSGHKVTGRPVEMRSSFIGGGGGAGAERPAQPMAVHSKAGSGHAPPSFPAWHAPPVEPTRQMRPSHALGQAHALQAHAHQSHALQSLALQSLSPGHQGAAPSGHPRAGGGLLSHAGLAGWGTEDDDDDLNDLIAPAAAHADPAAGRGEAAAAASAARGGERRGGGEGGKGAREGACALTVDALTDGRYNSAMLILGGGTSSARPACAPVAPLSPVSPLLALHGRRISGGGSARGDNSPASDAGGSHGVGSPRRSPAVEAPARRSFEEGAAHLRPLAAAQPAAPRLSPQQRGTTRFSSALDAADASALSLPVPARPRAGGRQIPRLDLQTMEQRAAAAAAAALELESGERPHSAPDDGKSRFGLRRWFEADAPGGLAAGRRDSPARRGLVTSRSDVSIGSPRSAFTSVSSPRSQGGSSNSTPRSLYAGAGGNSALLRGGGEPLPPV